MRVCKPICVALVCMSAAMQASAFQSDDAVLPLEDAVVFVQEDVPATVGAAVGQSKSHVIEKDYEMPDKLQKFAPSSPATSAAVPAATAAVGGAVLTAAEVASSGASSAQTAAPPAQAAQVQSSAAISPHQVATAAPGGVHGLDHGMTEQEEIAGALHKIHEKKEQVSHIIPTASELLHGTAEIKPFGQNKWDKPVEEMKAVIEKKENALEAKEAEDAKKIEASKKATADAKRTVAEPKKAPEPVPTKAAAPAAPAAPLASTATSPAQATPAASAARTPAAPTKAAAPAAPAAPVASTATSPVKATPTASAARTPAAPTKAAAPAAAAASTPTAPAAGAKEAKAHAKVMTVAPTTKGAKSETKADPHTVSTKDIPVPPAHRGLVQDVMNQQARAGHSKVVSATLDSIKFPA